MDVIGTGGADTLTGTKGDDVYSGLGGADLINATQGADTVDGGLGNDRLVMLMANLARFDAFAGPRTYLLTSTAVSDSAGLLNTSITSVERMTLDTRGTGDYDDAIDASGFVSAASLPLSIFTGAGDDTVTGSAQNDSIQVGLGSNWVDAGGGASDGVLIAYDNNVAATLFVTGSGGTVQTSFDGTDFNTILNAEFIDLDLANLEAGSSIDASGLTGFDGQLGFRDSDGANNFIGHDGVDFFANTYIFTAGGDTYTGGGGADIYDYTFAVAAMDGDTITDLDSDDIIDLAYNNSTNNGGGFLADQFIGAAEFSGVAGQYRFVADVDQGRTYLQVDTDGDGLADETLTIANGNFALAETAAGSNQLHIVGQSGSNGDDFLVGGPGGDSLYAQGGNDTIAATGGMDFNDGGEGVDQLRFVMANAARFTEAFGPRNFTIGNEWVGASDGSVNSYFFAIESIYLSTVGTGDYGDTIDATGYLGDSLIVRAGAGDDTLIGSAGSDDLGGGTGSNVIDGGDGYDTGYTYFDPAGGGTASLASVGGSVEFSANGAVSTFTNVEDIRVGATGAVGIAATVDGSALSRSDGDYLLVFWDHDGADTFIGSSGVDAFSNIGNYSSGGDTYIGNGGADTYDYTYAVNAMNGDTIMDLDHDDVIDLRFNTLSQNVGGALADQFIGTGAFSGVAGEYRFTTGGGQTFVEVDTDGDGVADQTLTIANGEFVLKETAPGSNLLVRGGLVVNGTNGPDTLSGTTNDDIVNGSFGRDTIFASQGHDFIDGGPNLSDRVIANLADAAEFETAATGSRTYVVGDGHLGEASSGLDTSFINVERVTLELRGTGDFGDTVDASAHGGGFALDIRLGDGDDTVVGGNGNETIYTRLGVNSIDGGGGFDAVYTGADWSLGAALVVTGSGNLAQTSLNGVVTNTLTNVEQVVVGGNIDDVFLVDGRTYTVDGSAYTGAGQLLFYDHNGDDVFIGSAGADIFANIFNVTVGTDVYRGNGGADIYDYTVAVDALNDDVILDLDADDVIDFQFNDGSVTGQLLADQWIGSAAFSGVAGQYRYEASGGETVVQVDTDGDGTGDRTLHIANGQFAIGETAPGSNILHIIGTSGTADPDTMTGTLGDDSLYAQGSNDIINGSQGHDFVDGGAGAADRLFMNTGTASLFAAATGARTYIVGADSITDSSGTLDTAFTGVERIALSTVGNGDFDDIIDASGFVSSHSAALDVRLGDGDNLVTGSSGNDRIFTGFGSNSVTGGDGYDYALINVDAASAVTVTITNDGGILCTDAGGAVNQLGGFEEVWVQGAGPGAVTLDASAYVDIGGLLLVLVGHNGSDIMIGSAGSDYFANITGQVLGSDVYTGNGGADIYDYTYAADSMNGDTITDFDIDDVIDLRFNDLAPGQSPIQATHFIGDAAFSGAAGEYRYQIDGTTTVVEVDSDGDGLVDQTLTIANGGFALAETASGSNILTLAAVINPLEGVVADGYVAGATLFVDVDGDGVRDSGEAWTTTDAQGNFTLNVNQAGTIVAVGGTNLDTGLANRMDLKAPYSASVVNPLTTLIAAVMAAGAMSAAAAEDVVKDALGLDSSLDLLSTDLLAQGNDAAALDAQKAAAMIANLVTTAETVPGATGGTEQATLDALAGLVGDGGAVDLTSASTLSSILGEALPGVGGLAGVASQLASEGAAIEAATSLSGISAAQLAAILTGDDLANTLTGNDDSNLIRGNGGNDTLYGMGGDDTLDGGTGADRMEGGLGNDLYIIDQSGDQVIELSNAGYDTVRSSVSTTLGANVEALELTGSAANGTGNALGNSITGNALANLLSGEAGNDSLFGGGGSDRLFGGSGNDLLRGGGGQDFLSGGSGNDRFVVDLGSDTDSKLGSISLDSVLDFQSGDKIDLSFLDANSLFAGDQDFVFKGTSSSKDAGTVWFKTYDSVQGAEKSLGADIDGVDAKNAYDGPVTILFGNTDGGNADFAMALINVGTLQAHDLQLG